MVNFSEEITVPINPESHARFMDITKWLGLDVHISKGNYLVGFNDPYDLYLLGWNMCYGTDDFLSSNFFRSQQTKEPPPPKNKK